ncbi:MAG: Ig-like domain-containing protein [Pirellulales bacterium]
MSLNRFRARSRKSTRRFPRTSRYYPALIRFEHLEERRVLSADGGGVFNFDGPLAGELVSAALLEYADFQFSDGNRWSTTATDGGGLAQGDPTTLTWSIIPDGTFIGASSFDANGGGPGNSDMIAFLDGVRGDGGGGADLTIRPWFDVFADALDRLASLSGLTFVYEPADDGVNHGSAAGSLGVRGDIRVGGRFVDGEPSGGSNLGYSAGPDDSDFVIDTGNTNFYTNTNNNSLQFRNVIMHEVGHGLGISHVAPVDQTKLMEPNITTAFDGPQLDDILALQRGYGDPLEKNGGNDSISDATPLGALPPGVFMSLGRDGGPDAAVDPIDVDLVSIDSDTDADYFRVEAAAGTRVSVYLTPLGATYDQGPDGNPPPAPTSFDSSSQSDLVLSILDDGGAVLATANAAGLGAGEEILDFVVPASGAYFVEVLGTEDAVQLFQIEITTADRFEENDTLETATVLGSIPYITLRDLTIDTADDEDWFKITAHSTGKLIVNAYFTDEIGDIDIRIFDAAGNEIDASTTLSDDEQIIIPVVSQEMYFLQVIGFGDDINGYELEIENFPAPFPAFVDLADASDTGMMNDDDITSDTTPTLFIQADLADFQDMGVALLDQATIDPDGDGNADDATADGAGVYVAMLNQATGALVDAFANPVGASGILWSLTVPGGAALAAGDWFISAAVQIVDGQDISEDDGTQRATGRAQLSDPLVISVLTPVNVAAMVSAEMLVASDSGLLSDDNVTNKMSPAFQGVAPVGYKVRLYANGELVGQTVAGSDTSDVGIGAIGGVAGLGGAPDDGMGLWEITSEPLDDGTYNISIEVEDAAGNVTFVNPIFNAATPTIDIWVDTTSPNTPFLDIRADVDTGRSDVDNITANNQPIVVMDGNATTAGGPTNPFPNDVIFRLYLRPDGLAAIPETLVYDSLAEFGTFTTLASLTRGVSLTLNNPGGLVIPDGAHNFKLEIEDRAGNISHDFLLDFQVDTVPPPVAFGLQAIALDGLQGDSDTGVSVDTATLDDRITRDSTPTLWGLAEANAAVQLFVDLNGDGVVGAGDVLLGETVAVPYDGNDAFANGYWEITSAVDLNNPSLFPTRDGLRQLLVVAEDVAGNSNDGDDDIGDAAQQLNIFLDTQGPRVTDVFATGFPGFNLFEPKPQTDGPTPRVDSLTINVQDLPPRIAAFIYDALQQEVAEDPGHYVLEGDHVGVIAITDVIVTQGGVVGMPASASIQLVFAEPLPDDRYTLSISDSLVDPAGNSLDGEVDLLAPVGSFLPPSGDGVPGGDFIARFTVDSRPEIGTWAAASAFVDINGNWVFDPDAPRTDQTNRDLVFRFGTISDGLFSGNFAPGGAIVASGFDKLGAYGFDNFADEYRFLLDFDHDGVADFRSISAFQINAMPVAGDFDPAHPGDEIGLFDGTTWYLDTDGDNILELTDTVIVSQQRGLPIVGDFNGDGFDDLAVYDHGSNEFSFDLDRDGTVDDAFEWGFNSFRDRPVAGDYNLDGIDDIGLFVPRGEAQLSEHVAEWYFLISDDIRNGEEPNEEEGPVGAALHGGLFHPSDMFSNGIVGAAPNFSPEPLGNDLFAQYGDHLALPLFGNFDPPVVDPSSALFFNNVDNGLDVDHDGHVIPRDVLHVINALNTAVSQGMRSAQSMTLYLDVDGNGQLTPRDALHIITYLNNLAAQQAEASQQTSEETSSGSVTTGFILEAQAPAFFETSSQEQHQSAILDGIFGPEWRSAAADQRLYHPDELAAGLAVTQSDEAWEDEWDAGLDELAADVAAQWDGLE